MSRKMPIPVCKTSGIGIQMMLYLRFVFFTEKRLKQAEPEQKQHQNQKIFCIFQNQNGQFRCLKTVKQIHGQHDSGANQRNRLEVEFQFSGMCEIGQTETGQREKRTFTVKFAVPDITQIQSLKIFRCDQQ
ncbi:MAG: hypothetical protein UEE32_00185 [Oscillospiraceae bacterium]|nr:hypothetical protein [Oscillospiraceae bacterium]